MKATYLSVIVLLCLGKLAAMVLPPLALTTRNLDMQYSFDLTNWHWWGTLTTTSAGAGLIIEERTNLVPAKFWRVVERP